MQLEFFAFCVAFCLFGAHSYNLDVNHAIVYTLPRAKRLSYFGMTVAIRPRAERFLNNTWVIQIGAPRSNATGLPVVEPGVIYRCRVDGSCLLAPVDLSGNVFVKQKRRGGPKWLATERKDNGWVGVAMDMRDTFEGEAAVVCGHRLSYQALTAPLGIEHDPYMSIGGCYFEFLDRPGSARLLLPLKREDRAYRMLSETQADFDWGQGLAGMSAHLPPRGLLVGAPHVYYMTGTVLSYPSVSLNPRVADVSVTPFEDIKRDFFAYNGYSVGSGKFFNDAREWNVFGAPRSAGMRGRVFAFQFEERSGTTILRLHPSVQRGETYGEYFGASLDVGDVNADGLDDLIVGAPMFSRRYADQGRAYVFLGHKLGFEAPQQGAVLSGVAEGGRFGTCVRVVGDLDLDGFPDVVIGAPNEDRRGAVYLYRGGARGLSPVPSQVVMASDIGPMLKGFGISVSRAVDVDRNHHADIVIGAYQSDQAVLLRTRPVVLLSPSIQHPLFLDRKQTSFKIRVCFPYSAVFPPASIVVDASVVLDEDMNRARFAKSSDVKRYTNVTTLFKDPFCQELTVLFNMNRLNGTYTDPVRITIENALPDVGKGETQIVWNSLGSLEPLMPITNVETSKAKLTVDVPFAGDCGLDNECHSHLYLRCQLVDSDNAGSSMIFVIGSNKPLALEVTLSNTGEPAHHTSLFLAVTGISAADVMIRDSACSHLKHHIFCDLKTLDEGAEKRLSFPLMTDLWTSTASQRVYFSLQVNTSSNETHAESQLCDLELDLVSDAHVTLVASPSEPTISLSKHASQLLNFSHSYEVQKTGFSPVSLMILRISVPTFFGSGIQFASIDQENPQISVAVEVSESEPDPLEELDFRPRGMFDDPEESPPNLPANRTLFFNCSASQVKCETHVFTLAPSSALVLPIFLNISSIERLMKEKELIHFSTNGSVTVHHVFGVRSLSRAEAATCVIKTKLAAAVETRVLVLSAVAGGLLLALILPILIKEGFFRRKTKEQMEALKTQDFIKERFSMYDSDFPEDLKTADRTSDISSRTVAEDLFHAKFPKQL